jgi:hypothetical protein
MLSEWSVGDVHLYPHNHYVARMESNAPTHRILLINSNAAKEEEFRRIFEPFKGVSVEIDCVSQFSQSMALLKDKAYDFLLVDFELSQRISAKFSIPMIKSVTRNLPIAVFAHDLRSFGTLKPADLGVDYILQTSEVFGIVGLNLSPIPMAKL